MTILVQLPMALRDAVDAALDAGALYRDVQQLLAHCGVAVSRAAIARYAVARLEVTHVAQ